MPFGAEMPSGNGIFHHSCGYRGYLFCRSVKITYPPVLRLVRRNVGRYSCGGEGRNRYPQYPQYRSQNVCKRTQRGWPGDLQGTRRNGATDERSKLSCAAPLARCRDRSWRRRNRGSGPARTRPSRPGSNAGSRLRAAGTTATGDRRQIRRVCRVSRQWRVVNMTSREKSYLERKQQILASYQSDQSAFLRELAALADHHHNEAESSEDFDRAGRFASTAVSARRLLDEHRDRCALMGVPPAPRPATSDRRPATSDRRPQAVVRPADRQAFERRAAAILQARLVGGSRLRSAAVLRPRGAMTAL